MNSTLSLFRYLYENLPPLVPTELAQRMKHALENNQNNQGITTKDVEETMITFGYEIWPWYEAFKEFIADSESTMGEHFLLPRLSPPVVKKYAAFKKKGGTFQDFHSGKAALLFSPEERQTLCEALVETRRDLKKYTIQEILSTATKEYVARVEKFKKILKEIKQTLARLRNIAAQQENHQVLSREIQSRIRSFEQSLCLLGPQLDFGAVCQSPEFFEERKKHLNRLKGIDAPLYVDFYS